jgi:small subunit ribosomal protein S10
MSTVALKKNSLLKLKLKGVDLKLLDSFVKKISDICKNSAVKCSVVPLPTNKKLFTVLTSPFIYSGARDQFFLTTHSRLVLLNLKQGQFAEIFKDFKIPNSIEIAVVGSPS